MEIYIILALAIFVSGWIGWMVGVHQSWKTVAKAYDAMGFYKKMGMEKEFQETTSRFLNLVDLFRK